LRSPRRDQTTVLWPLFSDIDDREKHYRERHAPWPLVVYARGEGKTTSRVFPFYSHAQNTNLTSDFIMWPVYKYNRVYAPPLDRERTRIAFFLYSDLRNRDTESGAYWRRVDFWPFFTHKRELNGNSRLQVLALLEPLLPENPNIGREYAPVYSLWRQEKNAKTGAESQSLLWNLYRRDKNQKGTKVSFFFGLYQSKSDTEGNKRVKLFFIPLSKGKPRVEGEEEKRDEKR
jgi:hypothetical protein